MQIITSITPNSNEAALGYPFTEIFRIEYVDGGSECVLGTMSGDVFIPEVSDETGDWITVDDCYPGDQIPF